MNVTILSCLVVLMCISGKDGATSSKLQRQKRCIVIQKQSGTHGDSSEDEDDDYRRPQEKVPKGNRGYREDFKGPKDLKGNGKGIEEFRDVELTEASPAEVQNTIREPRKKSKTKVQKSAPVKKN